MAFRSGDLDLAIEALAEVVRSYDNVSELARAANLSRENLYRSFAFPCMPRFRTVLIFLNELGLQLGIERLPSKESVAALQLSAGRQARLKDRRSRRLSDEFRVDRVRVLDRGIFHASSGGCRGTARPDRRATSVNCFTVDRKMRAYLSGVTESEVL